MRRMLIPVLLLAACAATPRQREMQFVQGIMAANGAAEAAVDFDIISADDAEVVQAVTRTATAALREAITLRRKAEKAEREGTPVRDWKPGWAIGMKAVEKALFEAARILEGRK